jgi:hypothetical protein
LSRALQWSAVSARALTWILSKTDLARMVVVTSGLGGDGGEDAPATAWHRASLRVRVDGSTAM